MDQATGEDLEAKQKEAEQQRGDQPRGDEKVRIDDVGPVRGERPPGKRQVAELPAGPRIEDGAFDHVAPRRELTLDLRDERPEVGRVGPGVHLRDEQDPHGGQRTLGFAPKALRRPSIQLLEGVASRA